MTDVRIVMAVVRILGAVGLLGLTGLLALAAIGTPAATTQPIVGITSGAISAAAALLATTRTTPPPNPPLAADHTVRFAPAPAPDDGQLVNLAATQRGKPYHFGAEADLRPADPAPPADAAPGIVFAPAPPDGLAASLLRGGVE